MIYLWIFSDMGMGEVSYFLSDRRQFLEMRPTGMDDDMPFILDASWGFR